MGLGRQQCCYDSVEHSRRGSDRTGDKIERTVTVAAPLPGAVTVRVPAAGAVTMRVPAGLAVVVLEVGQLRCVYAWELNQVNRAYLVLVAVKVDVVGTMSVFRMKVTSGP